MVKKLKKQAKKKAKAKAKPKAKPHAKPHKKPHAKPHAKKQKKIVHAHKKPAVKHHAKSHAPHAKSHASHAQLTHSLIQYDEKSCGVVLLRNEDGIRKYLILHYLGGHFDFPKGHVEKKEDEKGTVKRELGEETGIQDVKFYPKFREEIVYEYIKDGKISRKQVVFYLGETKTTEVRLSHEHKNFMWLDYEETLGKLTYENAKHLLSKAERYFL